MYHSPRTLTHYASAALLVCLAALGPAVPAAAATRPFQVDDLFAIEGVGPSNEAGGPYAFSPDGTRLAVTRVRARASLGDYTLDLNGNAGGDIWVQLEAGEPLVNITHGERDGSSWWAPQWSPDGRRLAMLSTRGGNVRLWLWTPGAKKPEQIGHRTVDLLVGPYTRARPYEWADNETIVYSALPPDIKPDAMLRLGRAPAKAAAAWAKAAAGAETTVSVVESGAPPADEPPAGALVAVGLESGERTIAAVSAPSRLMSPAGGAVAYLRRLSRFRPAAGEPIAADRLYGARTVEIASLDGGPMTFRGAISHDVIDGSLRWSPDGSQIAFLGYLSDRSLPPALYRLDLASRSVEIDPLVGLQASPSSAGLEWTADGHILIQVTKAGRRDWWLVGRLREQRCVTCEIAGLSAPPRAMIAQDGRRAFVGLAGGELWSFALEAGNAENLTARFEPQLDRVIWPNQPGGQSYSRIAVTAASSTHVIDLRSGAITTLDKPHPDAELSAYAPHADSAVYLANDHNGLRLWRDRQLLADANTFLRQVEEGRFVSIDYASLDGVPLKAWLLLPAGYVEGRRYPLLTWVYGGMVAGPKPPSGWKINGSNALNMQVPAGRGYAVLLPSMPLAPPGLADDPMRRAPEGVLPAIDKVVSLGIADPDRLFVAGQSFGGYSALSLITQTNMFKAAAALAAPSNLISLYGAFDARARYDELPQEFLFQVTLLESDQVHMGAPPWRDLDRYVRNSPLFAAEKMQTPLLIVQGDLDYVAMSQGEEMFTSLYRQGKRASLVRYWGEGHVLQSPANVRDMWTRIFAWFEKFAPTHEATSNDH